MEQTLTGGGQLKARKDRKGRKAFLTRDLAALERRRDRGSLASPTKWSRFLAQLALTDSSGELKRLAIDRGIIQSDSRGVRFVPRAKPVRIEGGQEVMSAAKRSAEALKPRRKIISERMPLRQRAILFWGMLAARSSGVKVGEEIDITNREIRSFTGHRNEASIDSFFSIITRSGMAEWIKGKSQEIMKLLQNPSEMTDEPFRHPKRIRLPAVIPSDVPVLLGREATELQRQRAEIAKKLAEAKQQTAKLAEEERKLSAKLNELQRLDVAFAREAARVHTAYNALSEGGKRAFIRGLLQNPASSGLVKKVIEAMPPTEQPPAKFAPPKKK